MISLLAAVILQAEVKATVETEPVPHDGDAADDVCIWIHPTDRSKSAVIGTDKQGGLIVYDLAGKQLHYAADGRMNNVDVRYDFPLGKEKIAIVVAGNRSNDHLAAYRVDLETRKLQAIGSFKVGIPMYGSCLYQSGTGTYAFVCSATGKIEQWRLFDDGGRIGGKRVRELRLRSMTEGCVADDELGAVYFAEEARGIWTFGAEPGDASEGTLVDSVKNGRLKNVEGLTIYRGPEKTGYLIASSQASNEFVVYKRGTHEFVKTFRIVAGEIDGAEDTDGIDVTALDLGPSFPRGLFVAQNGINDKGNQSFLLVPWDAIAEAIK